MGEPLTNLCLNRVPTAPCLNEPQNNQWLRAFENIDIHIWKKQFCCNTCNHNVTQNNTVYFTFITCIYTMQYKNCFMKWLEKDMPCPRCAVEDKGNESVVYRDVTTKQVNLVNYQEELKNDRIEIFIC